MSEVNKNKTGAGKILLVTILIAIFFVIGFFIGKVQPSTNLNSNQNVTATFNDFFKEIGSSLNINQSSKAIDPKLINEVYNTIKTQYVNKEVSDSALYEGAIKGMVNALEDDPTQYYTKKETETYKMGVRGDFEGIGAELGYYNGRIIIKRLLENSPAIKSNLKVGDLIMKVNDESIRVDEDITFVVGKIRGPAGSEVTLTVTDTQQSNEKVVKIVRANIKSESIEVKKLDNNVEYIRMSRFTEETLEEFKNKWDKTVDKVISDKPSSLVLDLRGNPGGYLVGAYYVASEFLEKDKIVLYVKDRDGISETYKVEKNGRLINMPLIVLIDQNSASASEILAGALQQNNRAKLIGTQTFGKGSAQTIIEPASWKGSSLHLTVQKWLLPDKSELSREKTLQPDIKVENKIEEIKVGIDKQLEEAIKNIPQK